jgi:hypothetical protein
MNACCAAVHLPMESIPSVVFEFCNNAVLASNMVHITRIVAELRAEGRQIEDETQNHESIYVSGGWGAPQGVGVSRQIAFLRFRIAEVHQRPM